jgi:hypothetical protein
MKMKDLAIDRMNAELQPEWFISRIASQEYVHRNSLEAAAWRELKRLERWIINAKDIADFKDYIKEIIDDLNENYPRCKPIELSSMDNSHYESIEKHDTFFYLSCNMTLVIEAYKGFAVNEEGIEIYKL